MHISAILSLSLLHAMLVVFFCLRCGLIRAGRISSRIECEYSERKALVFTAVLWALSLYLNLLLMILSATGDSKYFQSVTARLANEPHPFLGYYTDGIKYPPLFMYLYYGVARLIALFHIPFDLTSRAFIFMVKLPGVVCEYLIAGLTLRCAGRHMKKEQLIPVLLLTMLHPAYLFISAYICQIDALYSFFVLLTIALIYRRRLPAAYFSFAAAILCKFQSIFITPVLIYAIIDDVFLHDFNWRRFWLNLCSGLTAVLCIFLSYLPFVWDASSGRFIPGGFAKNFTISIQSYGLASQNTYNFWTLFGFNFCSQELPFGPLSCHIWGNLFIIVVTVLSAVLFLLCRLRTKASSAADTDCHTDRTLYPMLGALLVSGTVCFATKMMPRYLYPAVALLIFAFALKPTARRLACAISFGVCFFLLTTFDYIVYPVYRYHKGLIAPRLIALYFIACFAFLVYTIVHEIRQQPGSSTLHAPDTRRSSV